VPKSEVPANKAGRRSVSRFKPPPFAQQRFTEAEATDLSPAARAFTLEKLKAMRTGDVFTPTGLQPSVALPQFNGGGEWGGGAFDPQTHMFYVNASNEAEWISMAPVDTAD